MNTVSFFPLAADVGVLGVDFVDNGRAWRGVEGLRIEAG